MKKIYRKSYWFWIISKFVVAIFILITILISFIQENLEGMDLAVNIFFLIISLLLVITLFPSLTSNISAIRSVTGGSLILFGLTFLVIILIGSNDTLKDLYLFSFIFCFWIIMIGFFDVLRINKTTANNGYNT